MLLFVVVNDVPYFLAHRLHVALAARQAGYAVEIIGPEQDLPESFLRHSLPYHAVPMPRGRLDLLADGRCLLALGRLLRARKPDLVHAITIKPVLFAGLVRQILQLFGQRDSGFVAMVPGRGTVFAPASQTSLKGRLRRRLVECAYRLALRDRQAAAMFETEADRAYFVEAIGLSPERAHVVNGAGVNLSAFSPGPERQGPFTVLFAGRLLRSKGVGLVVGAAQRLAKTHPDIVWSIAGWRDDTPDALSEAEIEALKGLGTVRFLGHVADMPALLRQVDAVAVPTTYLEGIPRILLEAGAAGLPVIASDFPGARAVLIPDETGMILAEPSAEALADAAVRLASRVDRGAALGQAAQRRIESGGYDEASVQRRFLDIFASVTKRA